MVPSYINDNNVIILFLTKTIFVVKGLMVTVFGTNVIYDECYGPIHLRVDTEFIIWCSPELYNFFFISLSQLVQTINCINPTKFTNLNFHHYLTLKTAIAIKVIFTEMYYCIVFKYNSFVLFDICKRSNYHNACTCKDQINTSDAIIYPITSKLFSNLTAFPVQVTLIISLCRLLFTWATPRAATS